MVIYVSPLSFGAFDVSSAYDMVDHEILLQRLQLSCGLSAISLLWFKSYLTDRKKMVVHGDSRTERVGVKFGVPQCSVLGPILYIFFTADISLLFSKHMQGKWPSLCR